VLEKRGGPFIALQENLAIGVLEIQTCLGQGRTCPVNLSGTWLGNWICLVQDLVAKKVG
jgi:hypothetical protein